MLEDRLKELMDAVENGEPLSADVELEYIQEVLVNVMEQVSKLARHVRTLYERVDQLEKIVGNGG